MIKQCLHCYMCMYVSMCVCVCVCVCVCMHICMYDMCDECTCTERYYSVIYCEIILSISYSYIIHHKYISPLAPQCRLYILLLHFFTAHLLEELCTLDHPRHCLAHNEYSSYFMWTSLSPPSHFPHVYCVVVSFHTSTIILNYAMHVLYVLYVWYMWGTCIVLRSKTQSIAWQGVCIYRVYALNPQVKHNSSNVNWVGRSVRSCLGHL